MQSQAKKGVFEIRVSTLFQKNLPLEINETWTLEQLKEVIRQKYGISRRIQKLIFNGNPLETKCKYCFRVWDTPPCLVSKIEINVKKDASPANLFDFMEGEVSILENGGLEQKQLEKNEQFCCVKFTSQKNFIIAKPPNLFEIGRKRKSNKNKKSLKTQKDQLSSGLIGADSILFPYGLKVSLRNSLQHKQHEQHHSEKRKWDSPRTPRPVLGFLPLFSSQEVDSFVSNQTFKSSRTWSEIKNKNGMITWIDSDETFHFCFNGETPALQSLFRKSFRKSENQFWPHNLTIYQQGLNILTGLPPIHVDKEKVENIQDYFVAPPQSRFEGVVHLRRRKKEEKERLPETNHPILTSHQRCETFSQFSLQPCFFINDQKNKYLHDLYQSCPFQTSAQNIEIKCCPLQSELVCFARGLDKKYVQFQFIYCFSKKFQESNLKNLVKPTRDQIQYLQNGSPLYPTDDLWNSTLIHLGLIEGDSFIGISNQQSLFSVPFSLIDYGVKENSIINIIFDLDWMYYEPLPRFFGKSFAEIEQERSRSPEIVYISPRSNLDQRSKSKSKSKSKILIKQHLYPDPFGIAHWNQKKTSSTWIFVFDSRDCPFLFGFNLPQENQFQISNKKE